MLRNTSTTPFLDRTLCNNGGQWLKLDLGITLTVTADEIKRLMGLFDVGELTRNEVEKTLADLPDLGNIEYQRKKLVEALIVNCGTPMHSLLKKEA
jgi:hypothetical protein